MPHHVVVDGSNLATEGRERPSLRQLNDAVLSYMQEDPDALVTVVVDATFGHRIDPKEVAEFDEAINNNELVAPPAGAIGRGDAFVLSIANKVNAVILTNDSYQEFHAQYPWLFDEGRLVGGKPVPHIGWVFVKRLPVRGPISRKVTAQAKKPARATTSVAANQPMPVPTAPPPGPAVAPKRAPQPKAAVAEEVPAKTTTVNDLVSFLTFVEHHPVGSTVSATVHHYSSHGAYVQMVDVMGYVPLRLMADPQPRSAREFMKLGETVELVVQGFIADKRSIDLATPAMSAVTPVVEPAPKAAKPRRTAKKSAPAAVEAPAEPTTVVADDTPSAPPAKKAAAKKTAAKKTPAKKAVAKQSKAPASAPAAASPAPEVPSPPVKKAATRKAVAPKAAVNPAPAKKAATKKAAASAAAPAAAATAAATAPAAPAKRRGRSAS